MPTGARWVGTPIGRDMGCLKARAGAQKTALEFWAGLGFSPRGEEYMDFHVPHEWTERRL